MHFAVGLGRPSPSVAPSHKVTTHSHLLELSTCYPEPGNWCPEWGVSFHLSVLEEILCLCACYCGNFAVSEKSKVPAACAGHRNLFPLFSSFTEKEEDSAEGMRRFKKSRTRARKAQAMVRGSHLMWLGAVGFSGVTLVQPHPTAQNPGGLHF